MKKNTTRATTHPIQSPEWAQFRHEWGNKVHEFSFGLITIHKLPVVPFNVAVFDKGPAPTKDMINELKEYAKENSILSIKLEPQVIKSEGDDSIRLLKRSGAVSGKTLFTPETFVINLAKSEDELLSSFHSKTRYNIRLAQKRGVTIVEDNSEKAFEFYLKLTLETANRQGFYAHNERYHRLMWKHLHTDMVAKGKTPIAHLLSARYEGKTLVTWILFLYKGVLYYPYGASTRDNREVMAPNLMMWEAIRFGKKHGCKTFDLWGREEGKGFTKFKEGYNPEVVEFIGTWDLVCSPLYWGYRAAEWLRWKILRLKAKLH